MSSRGHAVVIPLPIQGHINPMFNYALHLVTVGHKVTIFTTTSTKPKHPSSEYLRFEALEDGDSTVYGLPQSMAFMASKAKEVKFMVQSCCQEHPVSLYVIDFLLIEHLKVLEGAPKAAFWTSSAAMMYVSMNIGKLQEEGCLEMPGDTEVDGSLIPGMTCKLQVHDLPRDPLDPSYKFMRDLRLTMLNASQVVINTFQALEHSCLEALKQDGFKVVPIGPLLDPPLSKNEGSKEIMEWLSSKSPASVVYISFGTMLQAQSEQIDEICKALEEHKVPFLWKHPPHPSLNTFKSRTEGRGMVVEWSPQQEVLRNKSVGAFLTHCGWNSMLESISYGIPMIGWPQFGDQFLNCKCMASVWNVGERLQAKDGLVRSSEIQKCIQIVISNLTLRSKALELKTSAETASLKFHPSLCPSEGPIQTDGA